MHPLLQRNLRRIGLTPARVPTLEEWQTFLQKMHAAYEDADRDRSLLERSLAVSSLEMRALYDDLKSSSATALQAEQTKLVETNAIMTAILDTTGTAILMVSPEQRILKYNQAFSSMCGAPQALLDAGDARAVFACAHGKLVNAHAFLAMAEGAERYPEHSFHEELMFFDRRVYDCESSPVFDTAKHPIGRMWAFTDVTTRSRERQELVELNQFLDSIIENIPDIVFVKDAGELRYVRINRAGEEFFGLPHTKILGRTMPELMPNTHLANSRRDEAEILSSRHPGPPVEQSITMPHLGERVLSTKRIPIFGFDGEPRYILGIARDVTEQRRAADALRTAKDLAEQASRAKSDFLANMSHELRTPLNAILGFARILDRNATTLTDRQREWLRNVIDSGEHMLTLVSDLLDLREAEIKQPTLQPVPLQGPIEEAARLTRWLFDDRQLRLDVHIDGAAPQAYTDPRWLVQVLINLLSNAAKFSPVGQTVEVIVSPLPHAVRIAVRDHGAGIATEQQPLLFTYFQRLGTKQQLGLKGSGVGLALVRQLVTTLGGSLGVESKLGEGSTFWVEIPLEERAA